MTATAGSYVGGELELFAHAANWKRYWTSLIIPYLRGAVLEVGAGIGTNTRLLRSEQQSRWVCLEPDPQLLAQITVAHPELGKTCELVEGTIADIEPMEQFDAILYIDVLEHIEDDAMEVKRAAARLKRGGRLIVLSPAHNALFSPFDAAIGHYRRYNKKSLAAPVGSLLRADRICYLDSCGLITSLGNRLFLRQSLPTLKQILFWDRVAVPTSRLLDRLVFYSLGKSILGIWIKE